MLAFSRLAFAAALCTLAAATAVHAQQRVRPATNVIPSAAARAAQSAPRPTGLTPTFPAGVSSGSGAAVSTDPIAASTTPIAPAAIGVPPLTSPRIPAELPPAGTTTTTLTPPTTVVTTPGGIVTTPGTTPFNPAAAAAATTVLGAGATVRGPGQAVGGAGGFSATDTARSFFFADANHDGDLTRAEFGRLSISTMTFEEMDRNFDGIISRFEYDDSVR
jgi:hypothetical protein